MPLKRLTETRHALKKIYKMHGKHVKEINSGSEELTEDMLAGL